MYVNRKRTTFMEASTRGPDAPQLPESQARAAVVVQLASILSLRFSKAMVVCTLQFIYLKK